MQVPVDAKGSLVAGISDALLVGGVGTNIATASITVATTANANTTSSSYLRSVIPSGAKRSRGTASMQQGWDDGPGSTTLLSAVLSHLQSVSYRPGETRARQSLPTTVGSQANIWVQTAHANIWVESSLSYSPAWLFERYLYDRFGGDSYTHAMDAGSNVSWAELQSVTGNTPQSLLHDFAVAIAASGTASANAPYNFTSLNLRSTYVDQFGNSTTLSGPAPLSTLSASGTQTFNVLVGAYAYFSVPGTTPTTSASLTDGTNGSFDLNASVIEF